MDMLLRLIAVVLVFSALVPLVVFGAQTFGNLLSGRPIGRHLLAIGIVLMVLLASSLLSAPWLRQDKFLAASLVFAAPVWCAAWLIKRFVLPSQRTLDKNQN
jgi:hypothetical protein